MKIEHDYIGVVGYFETRYEYELIDFVRSGASRFQTAFNQGKQDALWLAEPKAKDFDYLCGWHLQKAENLKAEEEFKRTGFGEF